MHFTKVICRKRKVWPTDIPDYCHFTMLKENKDVNQALAIIAKFLG
jgi:tRNA(Glu) U13 pseudouridine synthase TruD